MVNKGELILLIESLPQEKQAELFEELVRKGIIKEGVNNDELSKT